MRSRCVVVRIALRHRADKLVRGVLDENDVGVDGQSVVDYIVGLCEHEEAFAFQRLVGTATRESVVHDFRGQELVTLDQFFDFELSATGLGRTRELHVSRCKQRVLKLLEKSCFA